jgi:coproporphyrinogen III oxidase-like Fe-S oxidoreductase
VNIIERSTTVSKIEVHNAPTRFEAEAEHPPTVEAAGLLAKLKRVADDYDLEGLVAKDRYHVDLKNEEQFWLDIYPRLKPRACDPHQMLDDWCSRERRKIVFLYLHVPYCAKRCDFCHFHISTDVSRMEEYTTRLEAEMHAFLRHLGPGAAAGDLFLGGGTASLLRVGYLRRLLEGVYEHIPPENIERASLELHPRTMAKGLTALAHERLINRVTMGVQTFSHAVCEANNRIPADPEQIRHICAEYRDAGAGTINLDFMSGLYRQTVEETVRDIVEIDALIRDGLINSVSVYARGFNFNSQFLDHEVIDASALLERFRVQLLYRAYFAEIGWKERPTYLYTPEPIRPPQPSALVTAPATAQALGFGNSARS